MDILLAVDENEIIFESFEHVVVIFTDIYSLVVMTILAVLELIMNCNRRWVLNTDQLEIIKIEGLKIESTPRLVDALLVSFFEEVFPLNLKFFAGIV